MLKVIINNISSVVSLLSNMNYLSISQWDVEQTDSPKSADNIKP
ncbi:hypothetical protein [Colwellia sp. D2M02]|nr:hypothetical protein [Colwellia sp. D2M02]